MCEVPDLCPVKRETGESPVRARHRHSGAAAEVTTGKTWEGQLKHLTDQPGDLPDTVHGSIDILPMPRGTGSTKTERDNDRTAAFSRR